MLTAPGNQILHPRPNTLTLDGLTGRNGPDPIKAKHVSTPVKRDWLDPYRQNAAKMMLERLPGPGEQFHCLQTGNFAIYDLILATLDLLAPATIETLTISTLAFNRKCSATLCDLIDQGKIGRLDFLCSVLHERKARAQCHAFAEDLERRRGRFLAVRCHAKVTILDATNDQHYYVEGSANLRSCACLEQFVIGNDPDTCAFHRAWIGRIFALAKTEDRHQIGARTRYTKKRPAGRRGQKRPAP